MLAVAAMALVLGTPATVARIVDGDTAYFTSGAKVRLIQIDTPERGECYGVAATAALSRELAPGARVTLRVDLALDQTDRYGRLLRYVYRGSVNVNVRMVRLGHAAPYFYRGARGRWAPILDRRVREARAAQRGLWQHCPGTRLDPTRGVNTGPVQ